jgi:hypothetical protein
MPAESRGSHEKPASHERRWPILLGGVVAFVFVFGAWYVGTYRPSIVGLSGLGFDARGNVIGALFSGLAFVGLFVAIMLQWRELTLQREDLEETREELRRSATAQENQLEAMRRVNANQIFFELVRYMDDLREARELVFELGEDFGEQPELTMSLDTPHFDAAERVAASFNMAGLMLKRQVIPRDCQRARQNRPCMSALEGRNPENQPL